MSYYRRLIEESEKKRILGLHNKNRKNPTTGLLKEDASQADFYCASNVGTFDPGMINVLKAHDGKVGYSYQRPDMTKDRSVYLINDEGQYLQPNDEGYTVDSFPGWSSVNNYFERYWYCKCEGGKCKVATSISPKEHECKAPQGQACGRDGGQQGTTPGGQQGGNCSKGPMDLAVSMGLNWKETKQKWIDAKCNGTTPCILGDATTNINLRNALCKGTWNPKTGGGTQTGDQPTTGEQKPSTQTPTGEQKPSTQTPTGEIQKPSTQTPTGEIQKQKFIEPTF